MILTEGTRTSFSKTACEWYYGKFWNIGNWIRVHRKKNFWKQNPQKIHCKCSFWMLFPEIAMGDDPKSFTRKMFYFRAPTRTITFLSNALGKFNIAPFLSHVIKFYPWKKLSKWEKLKSLIWAQFEKWAWFETFWVGRTTVKIGSKRLTRVSIG